MLFEQVKKLWTDDNIELDKGTHYMVNRILSMQPSTVLLSSEVNQHLGRIPEWAITGLFRYGITKVNRAPYIHFQKRPKVKRPKLTEKVSKTLNCSTKHAAESIMVLENMGFKVHEFYGLKDNE